MSNKLREYTEEYEERCFNAFAIHDIPCAPSEILKVIPSDDIGRKPSRRQIQVWIKEYSWVERKDDITSKALDKVREDLIVDKAKIFKNQFEGAVAISQMALEALVQNGFDSSASASSAYFKATEEIRNLVGVNDIYEAVVKAREMPSDELIKEIKAMQKRLDLEQEPEPNPE